MGYARALGTQQLSGHWNVDAISPKLSPELAVQSWWPAPPGSITPYGYSAHPANSLLDAGIWQAPSPMVLLPNGMLYATSYHDPSVQGLQACPADPTLVDVSVEPATNVDMGQPDDLELGEEAAANDGPFLPEELVSTSWRAKPTSRRVAAGLCIGLLLA